MVVCQPCDELCLAAAKAEQTLSKDTIPEPLNGEIRMKATAHPYEFRIPWGKGRGIIHDIHNAPEQRGRNVKRLRIEHAPVKVSDAVEDLAFLLEQLWFESRMRQTFKQPGPGQGILLPSFTILQHAIDSAPKVVSRLTTTWIALLWSAETSEPAAHFISPA